VSLRRVSYSRITIRPGAASGASGNACDLVGKWRKLLAGNTGQNWGRCGHFWVHREQNRVESGQNRVDRTRPSLGRYRAAWVLVGAPSLMIFRLMVLVRYEIIVPDAVALMPTSFPVIRLLPIMITDCAPSD
jgi:hypothetical protein